jgi:hypothetical protein
MHTIRDAHSAEWDLMSPVSLTPNVRGHGFQMHHYAEAKPTAPSARSKALGFPCIPIRDARSAEWELMSA